MNNESTIDKTQGKAIAIDLGDNGVTINDVGDGDIGPNNGQNFPTLSKAQLVGLGGTVLEVQGTLNSAAGTTYTIQFFQCDAAVGGSIFVPLESMSVTTDDEVEPTSVTTDDQGNGAFTFTVMENPFVGKDTFIAATATDPKGNTSELSFPCIEVGEE